MKRWMAALLVLMMLAALCACTAAEGDGTGDVTGGIPGKNTADTGVNTDPPEDGDGKVVAIGVANPYSEITAEEANESFGVLLSVPEGASGVHFFNIETGGDTRMLQMQFTVDGVQYVLRAKQAGRLTNISAVYSKWDKEEDCTVSGCPGTVSTASNGSGTVMWYDAAAGVTFALSAQTGAVSTDLIELAGMLYTAKEGGPVLPDEDGEDKKEDDGEVIPPPPPSEPVTVKIYYPADDGVSFAGSGFTTDELTADYLVGRLADMGVLTGNVTVNWMNAMTIDEKGNSELALSLSAAFQTQLTAADAKGEYMLVGSVVNTFLEAFDASRIWLYVDNDAPHSTRNDYNKALTAYGSYKAAAEEEEKKEEEKKEEEIPTPPDPDLTLAEKICELAKSKVGAEYEYGAAGPDTFDNSGFVYWCFKENGVSIARRTTDMFKGGSEVGEGDLQPGDIVFFTYEDDRSPSYVGIYLGGGKFIAENKAGNPVKVMDMTTQYFKDIYVGARRYT